MAKTVTTAVILLALAATTVSAQTTSPLPPLRLTVDEAVRMALDHNTDLSADRLDPQISDTRVAAAAGAFKPAVNSSVNRNNQIQPPSSFLIPTPTQTDAVTSSAGLSQKLPWFGTSYSASWTAVHTDTNSFISSYNPLLTSGLSLSVSQPLMVIVNPIVSIWLSVWLFGEYFTNDNGVIAIAAVSFVALAAGAVLITRTSPRLDEPVRRGSPVDHAPGAHLEDVNRAQRA